tara:strand:+ start:590 stop:766 length:177 start_codon:yes stop_codon:yes gene_type:complete
MSRLILKRKPDESVLLRKDNEDIAKITVTSVNGKKVLLAFEADKEVSIMRTEKLANNR